MEEVAGEYKINEVYLALDRVREVMTFGQSTGCVILPGQNFTARLSGQDRVEGMIFGFSDPDLGQILGFSKDLAE